MNYSFNVDYGHIKSTARRISYIFGMTVRDNRLGKNYHKKRSDVIHSEIILANNAPAEYRDVQTFVDKLQEAELRRGKIKNVSDTARTLRVMRG